MGGGITKSTEYNLLFSNRSRAIPRPTSRGVARDNHFHIAALLVTQNRWSARRGLRREPRIWSSKGLWVITGGAQASLEPAGKILTQALNLDSFPLQRQVPCSQLLSATLVTRSHRPTHRFEQQKSFLSPCGRWEQKRKTLFGFNGAGVWIQSINPLTMIFRCWITYGGTLRDYIRRRNPQHLIGWGLIFYEKFQCLVVAWVKYFILLVKV